MPESDWIRAVTDDELPVLITALGKADEDWTAMLERLQEVPREYTANQHIIGRLIKEVRRRLQDLPPATIDGPGQRCQWPRGCPTITGKTMLTTRGEIYLCDVHIAAVEAARVARQAGALARPDDDGDSGGGVVSDDDKAVGGTDE